MEAAQIAVVSVPLDEWNAQKALIREIADHVKSIAKKEQKELLSPKEVCEVLKISRSTYERYINEGIIQVTKLNQKKYSRNYVERSYLEQLIQDGKI